MALRHRFLTLIGLGFTLACLSGQTLAKEFYKWQDEEGVTHYSSQPSKTHKSVKVHASNIKGDPESTSSASSRQNENQAQGSSADAEVYKKDPERCAAAQRNKQTLEENARIRIKEGDEYRYLSQEEIKKQMDMAMQAIADDC
ncbi:DUF4124 domain-containing protein [Aestuariicella sp. G3-2]|uniref:DUF4124 domain-containing protein n=1 Tax=Pseudomaricurvus albidus TaxID=2842452 RepID=UPI001C0AF516|nr:DUF4124 domain-containing protein [Aestuariicella albida]MBU3068299.1 DUF4124 domain-containing protein [Aestuariicella albida]